MPREGERRCASCGYRSANSEFFRRERSGVCRISRTFCYGCAPYRPSRNERAPIVLVVPILIACGAVAFWSVELPPLLIVPIVAYILVALILAIVVHEFGHAGAARLAGISVFSLTLGSGPLYAVIRVGAFPFYVRTYLLSGGITQSFYDTVGPARWREAVLLAGGAGANVLAATFGFVLLVAAGGFDADFLTFVSMLGLGVSQSGAAVIALVPRTNTIGFARLASDGKRLLALPRSLTFHDNAMKRAARYRGAILLRERRYEAARDHFRGAHRRFPDDGVIFAFLLDAAAKAEGHEAAVACYLDDASGADPFDQRDKLGFTLAAINLAWSAALSGDLAVLDLADRVSQRAIELLATNGYAQAARGAVLTKLNQTEAGAALLTTAARAIVQLADKADIVAYLAETERAGGRTERADELDRLARHCTDRAIHREETR